MRRYSADAPRSAELSPTEISRILQSWEDVTKVKETREKARRKAKLELVKMATMSIGRGLLIGGAILEVYGHAIARQCPWGL